MDHYTYDQIEAIAKLVQSKSPDVRPEIAIICGTGLGGLADLVDSKTEIAYEEIPSFPRSTGKLQIDIKATPLSCVSLSVRVHIVRVPNMYSPPIIKFELGSSNRIPCDGTDAK